MALVNSWKPVSINFLASLETQVYIGMSRLYSVKLNSERLRLSEQQRQILEFYVIWRDEWKKPQTLFEIPSPRIKHFSGAWGGALPNPRIPTIWVRDWLFGEHATPSQKASLSRSLRQLEAKKLIVCCTPTPKQSYATHYYITEKGERAFKAITS